MTNAGVLLADESPIYCSRLFCTRWNGIDKASGVIDALDDRGSGFKKIMQAYEVELNYTEDKKPVFYSNATEFRVILKNK